MDRIATATKAVDLYGAGKHGWKDGNKALGIVATDFEAAFMNGVQEELVRIIEAAGIAPNAGTLNQVLTALRSAGVFQTAAQFDNTTKAATTAFVKAVGLQAAGLSSVTATGALTAAHAGGTVVVNAAGATTQTLPAANALPTGGRIELMNINAGVATVSRAGADTIQVNAATVTSLALGAGDTLTVESDGVSRWYAVGGTARMAYANTFGALIAGNGYQRLPSGLIIQWGSANIAAGAAVTVNFPIVFPNACLSATCNDGEAVPTSICDIGVTFTASALTLVSAKAGVSANAGACYWLAVGN